MPNTVRDWMSSPVIFVDPDSKVSQALTLMRRHKIHSLIVDKTEQNQYYGIVTTTDIRDKIVALDRNPSATIIREIMSGPVSTAKPEWTLKECSRIMHEHRVHHLPVADEHGTLIGLISVTDIFMAVEETGWKEKNE